LEQLLVHQISNSRVHTIYDIALSRMSLHNRVLELMHFRIVQSLFYTLICSDPAVAVCNYLHLITRSLPASVMIDKATTLDEDTCFTH